MPLHAFHSSHILRTASIHAYMCISDQAAATLHTNLYAACLHGMAGPLIWARRANDCELCTCIIARQRALLAAGSASRADGPAFALARVCQPYVSHV